MSIETLGLSMQQYIQVISLARYYNLDEGSLLSRASMVVSDNAKSFDNFLNKTEEEKSNCLIK